MNPKTTIRKNIKRRTLIVDDNIRFFKMIKKIRKIGLLAVGAIVLLQARQIHAADATPPERMTYQGFLVDGNGAALAPTGPSTPALFCRFCRACVNTFLTKHPSDQLCCM